MANPMINKTAVSAKSLNGENEPDMTVLTPYAMTDTAIEATPKNSPMRYLEDTKSFLVYGNTPQY